jgi:DNA-directed RNA polymerase specialized sigma24 family protein
LELAEIIEESATVTRAVSYLPEYYRNVVVLHDLMDYKCDEVAKAAACPLGT